MRARSGRPFVLLAGAWLALAVPAPVLDGQARTLGAQDCEKCHRPALNKWRRDEPAQYGPKAHFNTDKQLRDPKAAAFARAIGLDDPAQPGGRCAQCHATVVRGSVRAGVSCESCHGAASTWLTVHDKEPYAESYQKSLPLGLRNLHKNPAAIAALCVGCHVTADRALVEAKHPTGADIDVGAGLRKLVHWTSAFTADQSEHASYDYAQLSALGRPLVQKALAGGGPRPPAGPGSGKPTTPATAVPGARGATPAAAAGRPGAPPPDLSLFAESVAVRQCPPDCPGADEPPPVETPTGVPAPAASAAPAVAPAVRRVQRSIVVDRPAVPQPALEPTPAPAVASVAPRSASAEASALRGQAVELVAQLLARKRKGQGVPAPAPPVEFRGPDSELLNLQDLALALALETLRSPEEP